MDCRKHLFWSLALLGGMAGCTSTGTTTPPSQGTVITDPAKLAGVNPADIKKECDLPKKQPTPKICVAYGDAASGEAAAHNNEPLVANQLRETARIAYQQALRLDPKCLEASLGLARLYRQMDDHQHAVAILMTASKDHPNDSRVWFELGVVYKNRMEWEPAIEYLTKAAQLDPENRTCVDMLGYATARAGHPQEAIQVFMRVTSEAKAYYNVGRMLEHMNQPELSRQYFLIALQKDPRLNEAQKCLAQLDGAAPANLQQASYAPAVVGTVDPATNP